MKSPTPRVRLFAGPNGSGKSTLRALFSDDGGLPSRLLGVYLNPDEIEERWKRDGGIDLDAIGIKPDLAELRLHLSRHPLVNREGRSTSLETLGLRGSVLLSGEMVVDSYLASALVEYLRSRLLASGRDFSFESVMSSKDKVLFMQEAKAAGFRTYLYFVATNAPSINVARVRSRQAAGGHGVPEDKIASRYIRSLDLLLPAMKVVDRAYIFDNSGRESVWIAEVSNGRLETKVSRIPRWFRTCVLDRLPPAERITPGIPRPS